MKETKNKKIEAKCSSTEYEKVLKMASANKMSIAEFVRARVLVDEAPKYSLFESRVLKILSASAAWIQLKARDLDDDKFEEFKALKEKIEEKNGIGNGLIATDNLIHNQQ